MATRKSARYWHIEIMEWVPAIFIAFKVSVLSIGMFYAVKWHYDQERKKGTETQHAVLRASLKLAALFVLLVVGLLLLTFTVGTRLGLDLNLP